VQFSSTGREWACATSDGLLVYALSEDLLFAPVGLEVVRVTPPRTVIKNTHHHYSTGTTNTFKTPSTTINPCLTPPPDFQRHHHHHHHHD